MKCIPQGSQYPEAIRDVIKWHEQYPDDWEKTWELVSKKNHGNPVAAGLPRRPRYSLGDGATMVIDIKSEVKYHFDRGLLKIAASGFIPEY